MFEFYFMMQLTKFHVEMLCLEVFLKTKYIYIITEWSFTTGGPAAEPGLLPNTGAGQHRQQRPQGRGQRHGRLQDAHSP